MTDKAYWIDDGTAGPPTPEDDAWLTHHIESVGRRHQRDPEPYKGQLSIADTACPHTDHPYDPCVRCEGFEAMDPNR